MKKRILITGGTSGIGKEISSIYHKKGYEVCIITSQNLVDTENIKYITQDLSQINHKTNFHNILNDIPSIERLILCAGKSEWGDFFEIDSAADHNQFCLNFLANSYILKKMRNKLKDGSKVLYVSSTSSFSLAPEQLIYSISKNAINKLFHGLYSELKKAGVSSTLAIPSSTDTPFWNSHRGKNKSNLANSSDMATNIIDDFERGKKYSTPTLVAKIQLYLSWLLPPVVFTALKNMRKVK